MIDYKFTVYLLHFDRPTGGCQHYLGITRKGRETQRWREHSKGKGASITRRALLEGRTLYVTRLWPTTELSLERRLKRNGHLDKKCPLCTSPPWVSFKAIHTITSDMKTETASEDGTSPLPFHSVQY